MEAGKGWGQRSVKWYICSFTCSSLQRWGGWTGGREGSGHNEGRDCRFLSWAAKLVVVPWGLWLQKELNHFWHAELQGPDGVSTHKYAAGTGLLSEAHEGNAGCTDGSGNTHMKENSPWEHAACRGKTEVGILISARTAGRGIYQVDEKELLEEKKDSEHSWWFSG